MKTSELKKFVNISEMIKACSEENPNKELENLERCKSILNQALSKIESAKTKVKDKYYECGHCHYFLNKKYEKELTWTTEIHTVCTYSDAGYGDDDRYADQKFHIGFYICPRCGKKVILERFPGDILPGTERDRWGNVYS